MTLTLAGTGTIGTFTAGAITGKWTFDYSGTSLVDGTYTFTINSLDLAGNFAATPFNVTVDNAAAAPVFTAIADDTGTSSTDRITRDSQILLSGTAEANSTLTLRTGSGGGPIIGTTTANGSGNWTFDYTGTTLGDGVYAFFASIIDLAGNTSAVSSPGFTVTADRPGRGERYFPGGRVRIEHR